LQRSKTTRGTFLAFDPFHGGAIHAAASRARFIEETPMLNLVVTLLIIALIAAVLGFGGIAGAAVGIAKIVFLVALVLFVVAALAGTMRTTI